MNFIIDFRTIPDIEKKLSEKEIDNLNNIFQSPEVVEKLKEIEKFRKKRQKAYGLATLVMILITLTISYLVGKIAAAATVGFFAIILAGLFFYVGDSDNSISTIQGLSFFGAFLYGGIYMKYRSKIEIPLKRDIMSKICKKLSDSFEYSYDGKYSFDDLKFLLEKKFLDRYNVIDIVEDSSFLKLIHEKKGFILKAFELRTRMVTGSGKNRKNIVTNHEYLMKVIFPFARIPLKTELLIEPDKKFLRKNKKKKKVHPIFMIVSLFVYSLIGLICIAIFFQLYTLFNEGGGAIVIMITIISVLVFGIAYFYKHYKSRVSNHQLHLEDIEFESFFDVYCDDEISSRMILTPAFMEKMVKLVRKTGNIYTMMFTDNTVYIKRKIYGKYMEVGTSKNMFRNVEGFLNFYIDMREILIFAREMHFMYLSQTREDIEQELQKIDNPIIFHRKKGFSELLFGNKNGKIKESIV